jgi:hypothetical protein
MAEMVRNRDASTDCKNRSKGEEEAGMRISRGAKWLARWELLGGNLTRSLGAVERNRAGVRGQRQN